MLRICVLAVLFGMLPVLSAPPLGRPMQVKRVVGLSYPSLALIEGVQGKVQLAAVISRNGSVESVRLLAGSEVLASAAEKALKMWRFEPCTTRGGKCETTVVFLFIIGDEFCDGRNCPDQCSFDLPNMVEVRSSRARGTVK
jgi:TonB family protein